MSADPFVEAVIELGKQTDKLKDLPSVLERTKTLLSQIGETARRLGMSPKDFWQQATNHRYGNVGDVIRNIRSTFSPTQLKSIDNAVKAMRTTQAVTSTALEVVKDTVPEVLNKPKPGILTRVKDAFGRLVRYRPPMTPTTVAVGVGAVILAGVLTWWVSGALGERAADKPIAAGSAMTGSRPVPPLSAQQDGQLDHDGMLTGSIAHGDFVLVKTVMEPEKIVKQGWECDPQAGTASSTLHGSKATYNWTIPRTIPSGGTTVTYSGTAHAEKYQRVHASIGLRGTVDFDKTLEERHVRANSEGTEKNAGEPQTSSLTVKLTPSKYDNEISINIGVGYNISCTYYYRRNPK